MSVQGSLNQFMLDRGHEHERRVEDSFKESVDVPNWFHSIRKSTIDEDHRGIDFIVETKDMGPIFLQIKSSKTGAKNFIKKYGARAKTIALVVIRDADNNFFIRMKIFSAIEKLRKQFRPY